MDTLPVQDQTWLGDFSVGYGRQGIGLPFYQRDRTNMFLRGMNLAPRKGEGNG